MKKLNRVVLTRSCCWREAYDTQRIPISEFRLLAEEAGGEWQYFMDASSLLVPIYVVYTKKRGRIILDDESVNFNRVLLYWEEGERTGNFLYFTKGDTDYDLINVTAYGKKVRKLIHHVIEILTPLFLGSTMENQAVQALIPKGDDANEGTESGMEV